MPAWDSSGSTPSLDWETQPHLAAAPAKSYSPAPRSLAVAFLRGFLALAALVLAGCVEAPEPAAVVGHGLPDEPMHRVADVYYDVAPDETYLERIALGQASGQAWQFHTWDQVLEKLARWNATYAGLVEVRTIGFSHLHRPLLDVVVTDESVPSEAKLAPILDGAHHGNEYEGGEAMLYAVDTLLENHATNATVRQMLRDLEVHVVPVVNPDGWVAGTRFNDGGVNLNRNYDIDWGDMAGTSNPVMGKASEATGQGIGGVSIVAENCGASAFSEPETQAMRDLFASLGNRTALYLTGHTPSHAVIGPWAAFQPPFPMPGQHTAVIDAELAWIRDHTEYEAGRAQWADFSAGLPYAASGSSMDWFYAQHQKPAFTVEVAFFVTSATSGDYPQRLGEPYDGLRYWMDATLPIPMHLLANAQELARWGPPTHEALLPELTAGQHPALPDGWAAPHGGFHLD